MQNNKQSISKEEPSFIDTLFKYLYIVLRYKVLVITIAVVAMPLAFAVLKIRQPKFVPLYKTTARVRTIAEYGVIATGRPPVPPGLEQEQLTKKAVDIATLMQSSVVLENVVKKVFKLKDEDKDAIKSLAEALRTTETHRGNLTTEPELNYVNITVIDVSAQRCIEIIESLIKATKDEILNSQKQTIKEILISLEKELEEARRALEEAKVKLTKFIVENKVLAKAIEAETDFTQKGKKTDVPLFERDADKLALQLLKIRSDISSNEDYLKRIERIRSSSGDVEVFKLLMRDKEKLVNPELLNLLMEQDKKLKDLLLVNKEIHPDVIKAKEEQGQIKTLISEDVDSAVESINKWVETLKIKEENITNLINEGLSNVMIEFSNLERNVMIKQQLVNKVIDSIQQLDLASKLISAGTFVVIDPPILPKQPFNLYQKTTTTLNYLLFSLILALGAAVAAATMVDYFSMTVKDIAEVEDAVGVNILGEIPFYGKPIAKMEKRYYLMLQKDPESVTSEAFRGLRTNIKFRTMDKKITTLLVTSLVPKEGKTFVSANLAAAFAQTDKKVLLIDCDLRKSMLHRYFDIDNKEGITQFVEGKLDVKPFSEILPNLSVMVAGKHAANPAELLGSDAFDKAIDKLKQGFDLIIVDSPPLFAVTDSTILIKKLDATVLVLRANITPKKALRRLAKISADIKDKALGIVFNGIEVQRGKYGSYYYYQYDYYGKDKRKEREKEEDRDKA